MPVEGKRPVRENRWRALSFPACPAGTSSQSFAPRKKEFGEAVVDNMAAVVAAAASSRWGAGGSCRRKARQGP